MTRTVMLLISLLPLELLGANECSCRGPTGATLVGQTICLGTPYGARLATCQKVLNNTSWQISARSCEPNAT